MMTAKYVRLSELDLRDLYAQLAAAFGKLNVPEGLQSAVTEHVHEFFPSTVSTVEVLVNSQFNDSWYSNDLGGLICRDADGQEVMPLDFARWQRGMARLMRDWIDLPETPEAMSESLIFSLDGKLPEVYAKVSGG